MSRLKPVVNGVEAESSTQPVVTTSSTEVEKDAFTALSASLAEIRQLEGVMGYILRSNTSAIIDLPPSEKVTEYAMFSSQMLEFSHQISGEFSLGDVTSMVVEGSNMKMLCMIVAENKIGIFMERNVAHTNIIKRISK